MKNDPQFFNAFFDGEVVKGKIVACTNKKGFILRPGHDILRNMQWRDAAGLNQHIFSPVPGCCLMDLDNGGPWPILTRTLWIEQGSDGQEANSEETVFDDALVVWESIQGSYSAYELRIIYSVRRIERGNSEVYVLCRSHGFPDRPGLPPDCGIQHLRIHGHIGEVTRDLDRIFRKALANQRLRLSPEVAEIIEEDNRNARKSEMTAARQARREYRRQRARPTASRGDHGKERRDGAR